MKTRVILLVALCLAACGGRQKVLSVSLTALNEARDVFVKWDGEHQMAIVHGATNQEDGAVALHAYRDKRDVIVKGFTAAYAAIAAAAVDDSPDSLATLAKVLATMYADLTAFEKGGT